MSSELDSVLEHMKTILTNPSFVPIEEVVMREEEIARLKDGWVKMEDRWRDAVSLIDSWRKRMEASGKPVDEQEMIMSLRLSPAKPRGGLDDARYAEFGLSAVAEENEEESMVQREGSPCPSDPDSLHLVPAEVFDGPPEDEADSSAELSGGEEDVPLEDDEVEEPNFEVLQESTTKPEESDVSLVSSPLPEPPQLSPLRNSNTAGNRGFVRHTKLRKPELSTITKEKPRTIAPAVGLSRPALSRPKIQPRVESAQPEQANEPEEQRRNFSSSSLDEVLLVKAAVEPEGGQQQLSQTAESDSQEPLGLQHTPRRATSRLPQPRNAEPQQSPLTMSTIAAKLAASEKEADAARVRAKLRAARAARLTQKPALEPAKTQVAAPEPVESKPEPAETADVDPVKRTADAADGVEDEGMKVEQQQLKPEKRKRDTRSSKVASRRRSTLSPLELQSLITGTMQ